MVGIDGSPASREALRWAVREATVRGAALRVVHTWVLPLDIPGPGGIPSHDADAVASARRAAEELVEAELADLQAELAHVDLERTVVEGPIVPMLLDAAESADLLVVGSRGRGGFAGLLLGSVSQQCAHHASCPVVIVRAGTS